MIISSRRWMIRKMKKKSDDEEDIENEMKIFQNALDFSNTVFKGLYDSEKRDCCR